MSTTVIRTVRIALALSLATVAAAPASLALACGGPYTEVTPAPNTAAATHRQARERATGQWPEITRSGRSATLRLAYPRFERSGNLPYLETFRVVPNGQLTAVERAAQQHGRWPMTVTVEEVRPGLWRVVGYQISAS